MLHRTDTSLVHGRGVVEGKCVWSHRSKKLSEVALSCKDFYLTYNPEALDYKFALKQTHPYYYQVQAQMMVTGTTFCLFMVYTDVDIAVAFVSPDPEVAEEIRVKSAKFFSRVLLPQMLAEWFVKTNYQPTIINPVEILEDGELNEYEPDERPQPPGPDSTNEGLSSAVVTLVDPPLASLPNTRSIDGIPSASTNRPTTMYSCCPDGTGTGPTVVCSNIDCLIGVYHKSCLNPPRKRFGKTWKCKPCADLANKRKRSIAKENRENAVVPNKVRKVSKGNPLQLIDTNQMSGR